MTLGILLTNIGSPDAPTAKALRPYLAEFLGDPRIVELPRWLWLPILHGIILTTRPRRSARLYRNIWTDSGSPLLAIAKQQAAGLRERLETRTRLPIQVAVGMRYGNPSITSGLHQLWDAGARRILAFPLFPQYSATTTAATFDAVFDKKSGAGCRNCGRSIIITIIRASSRRWRTASASTGKRMAKPSAFYSRFTVSRKATRSRATLTPPSAKRRPDSSPPNSA